MPLILLKIIIFFSDYEQCLMLHVGLVHQRNFNKVWVIVNGPHMGPEVPNSFKEVSRGDQYGKLTGRHQGFRKYVSPNQTCPVFWENVIFSAQGAPRKSWGTYFHVKLKNNWGPLSSLFSILAIKMHFLPFYFAKSKKVKKADPNYFLILHENMSPNFFWEPSGLRKWHYSQWKKLWHI